MYSQLQFALKLPLVLKRVQSSINKLYKDALKTSEGEETSEGVIEETSEGEVPITPEYEPFAPIPEEEEEEDYEETSEGRAEKEPIQIKIKPSVERRLYNIMLKCTQAGDMRLDIKTDNDAIRYALRKAELWDID